MTTAAQPQISASTFRAWLARAEPCATLEYHRGFLSRDRSPVSALDEEQRRALAETADAAFRAAEDGRVHLFHLGNDLGERRDVAGEHPRRVAAMRTRLHTWYRNVGATFLESKPNGPTAWRPH